MTKVFPYQDVQKDTTVRFEARQFRVLLSGWRYFKGVARPDMGGVAILDEDNHVVLADCLGVDTPETAAHLYQALASGTLQTLVALVNSAPRARFYLSEAGDLLEKSYFPDGPPQCPPAA